MSDIEKSLLWLLGVLLLAAALMLWRMFLSPEAQERRRRKRSHRRVISTAKRPMVSLAVDAEKPKDDPKR